MSQGYGRWQFGELLRGRVETAEASQPYSALVSARVRMACILVCESSGSQAILLTSLMVSQILVVSVELVGLPDVLRWAPRSRVWVTTFMSLLSLGQMCRLSWFRACFSVEKVSDLVGAIWAPMSCKYL